MNGDTVSVRAGLLTLGLAAGAIVEIAIVFGAGILGLGWTPIFVMIGVLMGAAIALQATRLRNYFGLGLVFGTVAPLVIGIAWLSLLVGSLHGS